MATFTVLPLDMFPKATPTSGCEAYPEPGKRAQLIFYWVFFMPLTALIPTLLVTLLCFHIWWKQLIPLHNPKFRSLLFYFARLLATISRTGCSCRVILLHKFGSSHCLYHLQPDWFDSSVFSIVEERHSECIPFYVVLPKPRWNLDVNEQEQIVIFGRVFSKEV